MKRRTPLVVAITGASSGIGRATARRFAVQGAQVALLARGSEALAATAREVAALGGRALALPVDVADHDQVGAAVLRIERDLGPLDIWINNASTNVFGRADQLTSEELRRVTDVAYHGYVFGTLAALRAMKPRDRGTIVQVGSELGYRGRPLEAAHSAAKHAVRGFTESLRGELSRDNVHVRLTEVQLPAVNTPQYRYVENKLGVEAQPVAPIYQPELAADAIHFAATHRRREVWVGGSTIAGIVRSKLGFKRKTTTVFDHNTAAITRDGRTSNLWQPVPGDHGAHGPYEFRARNRDPLARFASWIGAGGVATLGAIAGVVGVAATTLMAGAIFRKVRA
jgi:NADP-dependent 3-hydroxy acid dehydrogenase YdfG